MTTAEEIWHEYHTRLRAFIRRRVSSNPSATDDILHNVFLKMHAGLSAVQDETRLQGWLYRIAKNAIIDHFRAQRPSVELPAWLSQPDNDPADQVTHELAECLRPMIQLLPAHYREALTLSELQGMTQQEVARRQGLSLSGAKSRVQRGRALLKTMLADCCRLEFDHQGRLCAYERKGKGCDAC